MKKRIVALIACVALISIFGICLVACNADTYRDRLEKEGYTVVEGAKDDNIEWSLIATNGDDTVNIIAYTTKDQAKAAEEVAEAKLGKDEVYRTGKIVMVGTKQAIKDAK